MKKFLKYVLFGALAAALAVGFTGCYGEDIDDLKQDVADIKADISQEVVSIRAEMVRLESIIAVIDQAIENQNTRITQLENDLDLDNPDSAINLAIAQGDLATLNAAKDYADGLFNALSAQIEVINGFLGLNTSGQLVVNEAAPNNMLNGTYATLNDFIRALAVHLATLKGQIDANTANIEALQEAIGNPDDFWADDLGIDTVWEAIGYNYAEIVTILNRLDNLGGVDGRTLENFVEDVDAFIEEMNEFMEEINGRFDGFEDGETIIDMIEKFVGNLTSADDTVYPDATSMINGEIAKLDEKLTEYIDEQITALRDELTEYIDEKLAELKEELLGIMQDMVTGLMLVMGTDNDNSIVYDGNIGYAVIKELEDRTFGPNGEITFTEGTIVLSANPEPQPVLVKVTPDHADISAADFVLFDSTKRDYLEEGIFTYTVARYNGGVLTRAVAETGLWVVTFTIAQPDDFPVGGVLLSLGIVNNMADPAATDRIVSTGPVIDASTSVAPYTPVYYVGVNSTGSVFSFDTRAINPQNIYALVNFSENQIWDTFPSVDPLTGVYTPGTPTAGDDRANSGKTLYHFIMGDTNNGTFTIQVSPTPIPDGFRAWYVEFNAGAAPAPSTVTDWGSDINTLFSTDAGTVGNSASFSIPNYNALHRNAVEFNIQAVNIDATLVDPDGIPFAISMVAPSYQHADTAAFAVNLDDTYGPGDYDSLFGTDPVELDINQLGFTSDFMTGLTATYSIELEQGYFISWDGTTQAPNPNFGQIAPDGVTAYSNDNLGVMEVWNGSIYAPVSATTDWSTVTEIRFSGVDPKAMMPGAVYEGTLTLTESWSSTVANMGGIAEVNYLSGAAYPDITLTYPISITLGEDLTFDTTMMNYKPNFGPDQITIWPVGNGSNNGATFNFADAFTNIPSANIVFEYLGTNTGDISTVNDPLVPENYVIFNNIDNYASTPANTVTEGPIEAYYIYGPVWETAYGDGDMLAPWSENPIGIEIRRYMDWYELRSNDDPIVISLGSPTLPASTFFFASQDPSRTDITLGGNMQFDGNQRIIPPIQVTLSDTQYFTIDAFDPYGGNDSFSFDNIAAVSLTDPVEITITLEYIDDFGTVFMTAPFNVQITN